MRTYQHNFLVTPTTARQVLTRLANLPEATGATPTVILRIEEQARALVHDFPEVFAEIRPLLTERANLAGPPAQTPDFGLTRARTNPFVPVVAGLSRHVREVWKLAQKSREAEWMLFELRKLHKRLSVEALKLPPLMEEFPLIAKDFENRIFWGWWPDTPPAFTAFEQVMYHFQRMLPQARYCGNHDCQTPHFFAHKRRRYCSVKCVRLAQADYKRRWWHDTGSQRRRLALRKKKSGRRPK